MDDYYTNDEIDDSLDDDALFMNHVVGEDKDLLQIDNLLKRAFQSIE